MSPTYDFCCPECGHVQAEIRNYDNRLNEATCPKCEAVMEFMFPSPTFFFAGGSPTAKAKSQVTSKEAFMEGWDDDD